MKAIIVLILGIFATQSAYCLEMSFDACSRGVDGVSINRYHIELSGEHLQISLGQNVIVNESYLDVHQDSDEELSAAQNGFEVYFGVDVSQVISAVQTESGQTKYLEIGTTMTGARVVVFNQNEVVGFSNMCN